MPHSFHYLECKSLFIHTFSDIHCQYSRLQVTWMPFWTNMCPIQKELGALLIEHRQWILPVFTDSKTSGKEKKKKSDKSVGFDRDSCICVTKKPLLLAVRELFYTHLVCCNYSKFSLRDGWLDLRSNSLPSEPQQKNL